MGKKSESRAWAHPFRGPLSLLIEFNKEGSPIVRLVDPSRVLSGFTITLSVGFTPCCAGLLLGRPSGAPLA